ncbi:efflux RND transporter permease subunit [Pseudovibrio exalbescens]|uniref:efflux RND transporter permease subunit n=1 Tax=Pseudovibrio exalbescens TaxID=197461 RepID=UPI0023659CA4|nr:efflux RND transporter permease subunit [Pseudovibrio exalbescens]MDD7908955.1 efflux RND transporter permease subunit [Pseudovibrio exalbescens]
MTSMLEAILNRPRTVLTLMVVMVVAGIMSYINVPKEAAPDIDVPFFYVSIGQQGISPEDANRLIVKPMETELRGLEGLKEITTIASEGHVGVLLEFDISFDKDKALADIRDKVDQAKANIPEDADEPTIFPQNMALQPVLYVTLSGDVPERALFRTARRLQDVIEAIPTVKEANMKGHREELLEVVIDTLKMEAYEVSQSELIRALTQNNQLIPAGFIDGGSGRFNIKVPGLVETSEDVFSLPLKQSGESVVTLGDIATIKRTFKDASEFTLVNGERAITLEVVKRIGENIIENNSAVTAAVQAATKDLPESVKVNLMLDESDNIYQILGSLQSSIMTAVMLVMVIVVAALGLKSALLVGLSIPTSFMTGFLILSSLGMTVNTMVMFGLVLTVGMLVDGAIVMVEYADRKTAEGMPPKQAYIRASKLMFWPIVSSTATTLAAFLPMLLWPGVSGEFMSYLPIMVIIVLSASLLTAMVFLPVTGGVIAGVSAFLGRHAEWVMTPMVLAAVGLVVSTLPVLTATLGSLALVAGIGAALVLALPVFRVMRRLADISRSRTEKRRIEELEAARAFSGEGSFDPKQVKGFTGIYVRTLKLLAGNVIGSTLTIIAMVGLCAGILFSFMANSTGVQFFVDEEAERATVFVSGRGNMSAMESLDLVRDVNDIVLAIPGIENAVATAFPSGGSGSVGGSDIPVDLIGRLDLEFTDFCCRRTSVEIFEDIRKQTSSLAGIRVETRAQEGGPPTGKDIRLQVTSNDYDAVVAAVGRIRNHVDQMEGLLDQEDGRPLPGIEWSLDIDREQAARYRADISAVGAMVQLVTNGVLIGKYRPSDAEDEVDIRVRLPEEERTLDRFDALRLQTDLGIVPLANFVDRTPQQKVSTITRRDGLYAMDVKASVDQAAGFLVDDKVKELQAWLDSQSFPEGVFLKFRGADEEQKESGAFLMQAMIGSLFLMFIILVTQYNSFYQSVLTLSTVVLSVFGVLLGMLVTGQKFSIIMTGTGVVALAGIVVNNAIVLIDTYNRLRSDGVEPMDAILQTSAQRLRPVLLTTITTIAGLIPMATQLNFDFFSQVTTYGGTTAVWWVQLSTAIIAGLGFSTLLTLIMIPVMLALPNVWWNFISSLTSKRSSSAPDATDGMDATTAGLAMSGKTKVDDVQIAAE